MHSYEHFGGKRLGPRNIADLQDVRRTEHVLGDGLHVKECHVFPRSGLWLCCCPLERGGRLLDSWVPQRWLRRIRRLPGRRGTARFGAVLAIGLVVRGHPPDGEDDEDG
ncbi:hypothetical protein GCM10011576_48160 [Micromonospora parathelypteridis]|nr:hypothetical protein GCM10011576_48160 [Micromonospora parathelypteridis]